LGEVNNNLRPLQKFQSMSHLIAPSVLSADFNHLAKDIDMINRSQADWFHIDVMDGVFVPNISFGMPVLKAIQSIAKKPLDVHLMIVEPERYIQEFAALGSYMLTVHYEASRHLHRSIQAIKAAGMKAGVSLNPHTPVSHLQDVLHDLDLVLIMSVNPGFGGQSFIPQSLQKIKQLAEMRKNAGAGFLIEVDGGVGLNNYKTIVEAGADVLVAGNAVFGSPNPEETIALLKS
jgi:ribulose-phosphate 3-epimerase